MTEIIIFGLIVLFALWLFSGGGDDAETPRVEVVADPMPDLPDNAKVMVDGQSIGNITPNPTEGGWSASNSDRALHGISSRENAIAALLDEHYRG